MLVCDYCVSISPFPVLYWHVGLSLAEKLTEFFSKYGEVTSVELKMDAETMKSRYAS